jgi:hypothetical protein
MRIVITTNFPEIAKKLEALREDIAAKATARAVNATVAQARTAMSKEIRSEFNISPAKVREKLSIKRASIRGGVRGVEGALESKYVGGKRRAINLINFSATKSSSGVSVRIKKGAGRKNVRGAFIGNNKRTVFERVGKARLPIRPVQTIEVPQMFNTRRIKAAVAAAMQMRFPAIFERELAYALQQFARP